MSTTKITQALALLALASLLAGCGEGTPVAPSGSILTLAATPATIGTNASAELTMTAMRTTGVPVNPGTEIVLTTTLGSVPRVVTTDQRGIATARLTSGNQSGTATITAVSGGATTVTTTVEIGNAPGLLNLAANPTRLGFNGGTSRVVLSAVDQDGRPLTGAAVFFSTTAGRLDSGGALKRTNPNGQAADTLRLSSAEAAAVAGSTLSVRARVVSGGAEVATDVMISVDAAPTP